MVQLSFDYLIGFRQYNLIYYHYYVPRTPRTSLRYHFSIRGATGYYRDSGIHWLYSSPVDGVDRLSPDHEYEEYTQDMIPRCLIVGSQSDRSYPNDPQVGRHPMVLCISGGTATLLTGALDRASNSSRSRTTWVSRR